MVSTSSTAPPIKYLFTFLIGGVVVFLVNDMRRTKDLSLGRKVTHEPNENDFAVALHESNGFFKDIPTRDWELLRQRVQDVYPNTFFDPYITGGYDEGPEGKWHSANNFYQYHYDPDFNCHHERRIGPMGDGGKWVCDPHRVAAKENCLVYSVGSRGDVTFETAVKKEIGTHCEIHVFDMADYSKEATEVGAIFHRWGISDQSFTDNKGEVYKSLQQTIQELGHVGRVIDIFKIDCEGCEWDIFPAFFQSGVHLNQILIELHANRGPGNPVPVPQTPDFFKAMYRHGYVIFHKEANIQFWHVSSSIEYAFLKLHNDFFQGIPDLANNFNAESEIQP